MSKLNNTPHHLFFEGPELAGKSWIMSQVYDHLESKYRKNSNILDGCHWFNCDIGIFGDSNGEKVIKKYLEIFEILSKENIIVEKFHLTDLVYNELYNNLDIDYSKVEQGLLEMNFKIVLVTLPEDIEKIKNRIKDRINLYPHYSRILKEIDFYKKQQDLYRQNIQETHLPYIEIQTDTLPDDKIVEKILDWIGEK